MFRLALKWILLFTICLFASFVSASFDKGYALYQEGKFDEAFVVFKNLSEIGDYSSMFNLGVMYYRGESVQQNKILAYAWIYTSGKSLQAEEYLNVAAKVFSTLGDAEKKHAKEKAESFLSYYSPENIGENIFPRLLNDEDCAPAPEVQKLPSAVYPRGEQRAGRMGGVDLEMMVSKEGYPRDLIVISATNKSFMKSAVKAAQNMLYKPYLNNGKPDYYYSVKYRYAYHLDGAEVRTYRLEKELEEDKRKASDGDPIAQYMYAQKLNIFRSFKLYLEKLNLEYQEANKWYLSSAKQGLPHAQFELGRNMISGRGCEVDVENGMKWINAAAVGGYSPAQYHVAQNIIQETEETVKASAVAWLRNAAQAGYYPSKLLLAWELSTSSSDKLRNGKEALELLSSDPEDYFDEVRILETFAAAYAESGNYKKAIIFQKKALKKARKLDWDIPVMKERLDSYMAENPWRGRYYL